MKKTLHTSCLELYQLLWDIQKKNITDIRKSWISKYFQKHEIFRNFGKTAKMLRGQKPLVHKNAKTNVRNA